MTKSKGRDTLWLQKRANALAKAVRQHPHMTDELYELLTIFNARLRNLEEGGDINPPS